MAAPTKEYNYKEETQKILVSHEEYERLTRIKLADDLKIELASWAKRQVWIIVVIFAVLGSFGASIVIESVLEKKLDRAMKKSNDVLEAASDATSLAEIETRNAKNILATLNGEREKIQTILETLESKAGELTNDFSDLDAKINNIRALSKNTQKQIDLLYKERNKPESKEILEQRRKNARLEENSKYSVLIFYRRGKNGVAKEMTEVFISLGFRSSSTSSDLSEVRNRQPPGIIRVVYTTYGKGKLDIIEKELITLGLKDSLVVDQSAVRLRNGEIQIYLF